MSKIIEICANILKIAAVLLLVFAIYESINTLLGHSLETIEILLFVSVSISILIATFLYVLNDNVHTGNKDITNSISKLDKNTALALETMTNKLSNKLDKMADKLTQKFEVLIQKTK